MKMSEVASTFTRRVRKFFFQPAVKWPLALFFGLRIVLSFVGVVLFLMNLVPRSADAIERPYFGVTPVVDGIAGMIFGVWQRFDVIHYLRIASEGYSSTYLAVFPPLYPLLIRMTSILTRGDILIGALVASNVSCIFLLIALYKLMVEDGFGRDKAIRASLYLLAFPTAFFLMAPYSESLFLLLTIVTFREARQGRWIRASLAGLAASLTRVTGVCLVFVIAIELLRQSSWRPLKLGWRILYASSPALGVGSFLAWQTFQQNISLQDLQWRYWHRLPSFPWKGIMLTLERIGEGIASHIEYLDLAVILLMLVLGVVIIKRLSITYTVYFWSTLIFNLSQIRIGQPLSGQARFCITLFPAFIIMAVLARSSWINRLILYPSLILMMFYAGQFVMWGWVG